MALIQYGGGITQVIGSIGGTTYKRTKAGNVIQSKARPTQPKTPRQLIPRGFLSQMASIWRTIGESSQTEWNSATANFPYANKFGESKTYSGFQLFVKLNLNLLKIGLPYSSTMPTPAVWSGSEISLLTADASSQELICTMNQPLPTGKAWVFFASPCLSAGIQYVSSRARLIQNVQTDITTEINLSENWQKAFGPSMFSGGVVFVWVAELELSTGQQNVYFKSKVIAD